jgi:uncharacterized protein
MKYKMIESRRVAVRILIFLLSTLALSTPSYLLIIKAGDLDTPWLNTSLMWAPGLAAMIACMVTNRTVKGLPWRWGAWKYNWVAFALTAGYVTCTYVVVWLSGLGGFPKPEFASAIRTALKAEQWTDASLIIVGIVGLGSFGVIRSAADALGEEIGWRGFLLFELRTLMPFPATCVVVGLIWALWHYPIMLWGAYIAGHEQSAFQMCVFTIDLIAASVIYGYFTLKSRSLWPATILHATFNVYVQEIMTPLTIEKGHTGFYVGEFGILIPTAEILIALYLLYRAKKEGL